MVFLWSSQASTLKAWSLALHELHIEGNISKVMATYKLEKFSVANLNQKTRQTIRTLAKFLILS